MPKQDPIAARRLLVAQVRDLAIGVGLAIRTARAPWACRSSPASARAAAPSSFGHTCSTT
jgi:hypothetical protein